MAATDGDRMPMPEPADLSDAQREAVRRIAAGPRGDIIGPFVPLLRSPELMTRLQLVGEFVRFESCLPAAVVEQTILQVARHWDQSFEWGFHYPLARRAGVSADAIDAIGRDERPAGADAQTLLVWDAGRELLADKTLRGSTYAALVAAFGEAGLVELVGTVGYYTTLALVMNATNTAVPAGLVRLPPRSGERS